MADLATLVKSLSQEQLDSLKQLLFADMANETTLTDTPGMIMIYNRSPDEFEFQWDSQVYTVPGHKFAVYTQGLARQAVKKGQYLHVGTPDVQEWIVPKGSPFFGVPMLTNGLTGDPIKDYPIDLRATDGESPVEVGKEEVFVLGAVPPAGFGEPRPVAKKTPHDNSIGNTQESRIGGAVRG